MFAPKAPRLIKGAYNNTIIRLKMRHAQTAHKVTTNKFT